jgi:hypothetical protein
MKKLLCIALTTAIFSQAKAQTNSATITQSGWYRIAINGPLIAGQNGGTRAAAKFILRDITSSLHQTVEFLAYLNYGKSPSLVVLNNSYYTTGTPPFAKIRLLEGSTYEGASVEVYVNAPNSNSESYYLDDNIQQAGWTPVNWQQVSTTSGDNDGVPAGFTPHIINLQNLVTGYVTDIGMQQSFYNGNLYISGNILVNKTSQTNTSYKLDINGNARANKIVVNTTGADYVFDSAYQLPKVDSLNAFIQKYHHLPGVLSAGEMQDQGLDVGDNQMVLLKKIEELTLYIIKINQELKQKNEKIQQLELIKLRVDAIEKKMEKIKESH